jgi:soluble lytic murein transglycosylase
LGLIIILIIFHKPILKSFFVLDYRDTVLSASREHEIQPGLLSAVIFVESRFQPGAKSGKGAVGLMQIMPATGRWVSNQLAWPGFQESDLLNPEKNIALGSWYIAYLTDYFEGNQTAALAAYNAGHRYVKGWMDADVWDGDLVKIESIPFSETKQYLFQIHFITKIYRYLYPELR